MKKVERAIQNALLHWLKTDHPEVMATATDNENNYKDTSAIGCKGITDLLLFRKRNNLLDIFFLELKTKQKGSRLNDNQIAWNIDFDENYAAENAHRDVAIGFADAKEKILNWLGGQYHEEGRRSAD